MGIFGVCEEADAGVGGSRGMKNEGTQAIVDCVLIRRHWEYSVEHTMMVKYKTMSGILLGLAWPSWDAKAGPSNCPSYINQYRHGQ
jgi:hypothetical protein